MSKPLNFQSIIMTLQNYWAEQGCLIWQPYYTQVGAGTYNPATFLRVIGPEPWNVAYVEPSIRPDDGRYGENPNRMQMHYQFQVILKPDPGNPQEMYLKSLEALGINPREHDIRFVEDNWESPALGAWGLGWEVWLDGQEITQFTYFQQAGGIMLDPVSVEITYGLERIAIALQRVTSFRDIQWSDTFTDGDVNLQAEQEHSKYYFETADIENLHQMFNLFEEEANACLAEGLVLPAHDYVLKCSHTFNILDTRGAVGVTERQANFSRMRDLSRRVAEAYLAQREALGFPWLQKLPVQNRTVEEKAQENTFEDFAPAQPKIPFLLEIGTEELPVGDLDSALKQLEEKVPPLLKKLRLNHGEIQVLGTPRRLVVYIQELDAHQEDLEQLVKGPPADRAFNPDGSLTKAGAGFARSKGIAPENLEIREINGGKYAAAVVRKSGLPAPKVLAEALPALIAGLHFNRTMRWNSTNTAFSRPIRWLLAILGEGADNTVIPFEYAGLHADRLTRGLRFHEPEAFLVDSPQTYFDTLANQGIRLNVAERRENIALQVQKLAAEVNGNADSDPALLDEVTNLVESPTALIGSFNPEHLELPMEVLISVMKKHQRYFPLFDTIRSGKNTDATALLPHFITVRNGDSEGLDKVREGNEHVIRARFADAAFFVREDLKKPLEAYLPKLATLTFQVKLGSMLDKTHRIEALVETLGQTVGLSSEEQKMAQRAAELCKADLATQMVVEMTSLQGFMGRFYALKSGEPEAVAQAIYEHYLPRHTGDAIPESRAGLAVGLADRLDSLAGLFAAGLAPTGNKDPFALRRTALGLVQNLTAWALDFDLEESLQEAASHLPIEADAENIDAALHFIIERLRNILLDEGKPYDVVAAVLAAQGQNPARAVVAVAELEGWTKRSDWDQILPAYSRCVRITRDLEETYSVNPDLFTEQAEKDLYEALLKVEETPRRDGSVDDLLNAFVPIIPTINRFFDDVLVMAEDEDVRKNRLGLLQRIARLTEGIADFSKLEGF